MSFGFSVGDIVAAGQLAFKLYRECKQAGEDYVELSELCQEVGIAIQGCDPNDAMSILRRQDKAAISLLGTNCLRTLEGLEDLLRKHQTDGFGRIRSIGRKFAFISAKDEREGIRRRLQEHMITMNGALHGAQINLVTLCVRLAALNFQDDSNPANLKRTADPGQLQTLFEDFSTENDLEKKTSKDVMKDIKEKFSDVIKNGDDNAKIPNAVSSTKMDVGGPVAASTAEYDPTSIDWYAGGGWRYLNRLDVSAARTFNIGSLDSPIRYSEYDEDLCKLPEGWSIIRTLARRRDDLKLEEAYYFRFNNLSCFENNVPSTSRLYFTHNPFLSKLEPGQALDKTPPPARFSAYVGFPNTQTVPPPMASNPPMAPAQWGQPMNTPMVSAMPPFQSQGQFQGPFQGGNSIASQFGGQWGNYAGFQNPPTQGYGPSYMLAQQAVKFVGFEFKGLAIDLSDRVSCEYAYSEVTASGYPVWFPYKAIGKSLPPNWLYDPEVRGPGRHIYINGETGSESTVHPARFYNKDDEPIDLPPNWDRRLDGLGGLFFVNKVTQVAVREDPRYDKEIDQNTGLPRGWHAIKDHRQVPFFWAKIGVFILGSYYPAELDNRSVKAKIVLRTEPSDGQDPLALQLRVRPRDKQRDATNERGRGRKMNETEEQHYHHLFHTAEKSDTIYISWDEARIHCRHFDVPAQFIEQTFFECDSNHDRKFNVNEYVKCLHKIKLYLEALYTRQNEPPMAPSTREYYIQQFREARKAQKVIMTLEEVLSHSKQFGLEDKLVRDTWSEVDVDPKDGSFNPEEFASGMHRLWWETRIRQVLSMEVPPKAVPTPIPPQTSPAPPIVSAVPVTQFTPAAPAEPIPALGGIPENTSTYNTGGSTQNNSAPAVEPATEPATEPIMEPATEPITEPLTEPAIEVVMEAVVGPVVEPVDVLEALR